MVVLLHGALDNMIGGATRMWKQLDNIVESDKSAYASQGNKDGDSGKVSLFESFRMSVETDAIRIWMTQINLETLGRQEWQDEAQVLGSRWSVGCVFTISTHLNIKLIQLGFKYAGE